MIVGLFRRVLSGLILAGVLICLVGVGSANAASPWWHVSSTSRPTYLQAGVAKDEVQQLTVDATQGTYAVRNPANSKITLLSVNEAPGEVQAALEKVYGPGNVEVTGGPGLESGIEYGTYEIKFVGALADRPVELPEMLAVKLRFKEEEEPETGSAIVKELNHGRPDGTMLVTVSNLGDEYAYPIVSPITITDKLPQGLEAVGIEGEADEEYFTPVGTNPLECDLGALSCTFTGMSAVNPLIAPYEQIQVRIVVRVKPGAKTGEINEANVTGGEAPSASGKGPIVIDGSPPRFGVNTYEMRPEEEGGAVDTQAGSHPFQFTTTVLFNETVEGKPVALAKDLHFKLPPGLIGNPTPFARCSLADFLKGECSTATALGVARLNLRVVATGRAHIAPWVVPVFNLVPTVGEPARFGFLVEGTPVLLDTAVRTGEDYGVTVNVTNISQTAEFVGSELTFWGVPGDPRHDNVRGGLCLLRERRERPESCHIEAIHPPPFLALPTSCTGVLQTNMEADSWKEPALVESFANTDTMPELDGCNRLQSTPSIEVAPDAQAGSTPTARPFAKTRAAYDKS